MTRRRLAGALVVGLIRVTVATGAMAQDAVARPTLAVADVAVVPGGWTLPPPQLSGAIVDLLVNELVSSQKFQVYDGQWLVPEAEIGRSNLERLRAAAAERRVDYVVVGSVTAFSTEQKKRRFGGIFPKPFVAGGFARNQSMLRIGLTLRIVDVRTGEIVSSVSGDGVGLRKSSGVGGLGVVHGLPVGALVSAARSSHARDAMLDEAVRMAVRHAALELTARPLPVAAVQR
jgi:curli biogenesis system outer membrane secretion channel CsgG